MLKIDLFFIFTNLISVKEKTHVPATVCFLNYAFNENTDMYILFCQMECFPDIPFLIMHKK